jgi:hypothetical protein
VGTTADLIETLSVHATPVRRLRPPLVRAGVWLLATGLVLAVLASLYGGIRPDFGERLREPNFALTLVGALLTGVLAAIAAFHVSLPDRSRAWLLLPLPPLVLWLSTIGYGCLTNWVSIGPGVEPGAALLCFVTLVIASVPSSAVLLVMLRHTARLQPTVVAIIGGLASAGLAGAALTLFHQIDASLMVLLFNLGAAALLVALAGVFGRGLFARVSPQQID